MVIKDYSSWLLCTYLQDLEWMPLLQNYNVVCIWFYLSFLTGHLWYVADAKNKPWNTTLLQNKANPPIYTISCTGYFKHKAVKITALFWFITQLVLISHRRSGLTYRSKTTQDSRTLNMGPMGCSETSVRNYHYSLRNTSEERGSQLSHGRSLKSRIMQ
jgi:hypothetical protein